MLSPVWFWQVHLVHCSDIQDLFFYSPKIFSPQAADSCGAMVYSRLIHSHLVFLLGHIQPCSISITRYTERDAASTEYPKYMNYSPLWLEAHWILSHQSHSAFGFIEWSFCPPVPPAAFFSDTLIPFCIPAVPISKPSAVAYCPNSVLMCSMGWIMGMLCDCRQETE